MYQSHPVFVQPENEDVKVWRYMDFTKFVSLLDTRNLFFARADKLGDPFEGAWPIANVEARKRVPDGIPQEEWAHYIAHAADFGNFTQGITRQTAVNCWHVNEHESVAMWKLYLKSDEGIAVQSTYKRFRDSLIDERSIFVGLVRYIDYKTEVIDPSNLLGPFVYKRKSFEYEREVRAVVATWLKGGTGSTGYHEEISGGIPIHTDIKKLVQTVYVAPNSPKWLSALVKSVVGLYGYDFPVTQSELDEGPVY